MGNWLPVSILAGVTIAGLNTVGAFYASIPRSGTAAS
jgi:hypothetical protein